MKSPKLFTLALSLALFLFATDSAFAVSSPSRAPGRGNGNTRPELPKIRSDEATIERVGSLSISVKTGKATRTYGIDDHTKILVSRKRSSAGALQKGMRVSVHPSTLDPSVAQSIEVDDPTVRATDPSKPAAAKKPTKPAPKRK